MGPRYLALVLLSFAAVSVLTGMLKIHSSVALTPDEPAVLISSSPPDPPLNAHNSAHCFLDAAKISAIKDRIRPHLDKHLEYTQHLAAMTIIPPLNSSWPMPDTLVLETNRLDNGFCNKMIQLFGYISLLRFDIPHFHLIVAGRSAPFLMRYIDLDLLNRNLNVTFTTSVPSPDLPRFKYGANSFWCAFRNSFSLLKSALRPKPEFRAQAEAIIATLKRRGARSIVTVHGRSFDIDTCAQKSRLLAPGLSCHRSNKLFRDNNETLCQFDKAHAVSMLGHRVPLATPVGYYLATDHYAPRSHERYLHPNYTAMRASYDCPTCLVSDPSTPIVVDMWVAALSDVYLANPLSSCEAIVAQWRHGSGVLPDECFSGYAGAQGNSVKDMCMHTNSITLDLPAEGASVCDNVMVLASALERLELGGTFVAWGAWSSLLCDFLDFNFLAATMPQLEVFFKHTDKLDFDVIRPERQRNDHSRVFVPFALDPRAELARAQTRREDLLVLRRSLRPRTSAAKASCPDLQWACED